MLFTWLRNLTHVLTQNIILFDVAWLVPIQHWLELNMQPTILQNKDDQSSFTHTHNITVEWANISDKQYRYIYAPHFSHHRQDQSLFSQIRYTFHSFPSRITCVEDQQSQIILLIFTRRRKYRHHFAISWNHFCPYESSLIKFIAEGPNTNSENWSR